MEHRMDNNWGLSLVWVLVLILQSIKRVEKSSQMLSEIEVEFRTNSIAIIQSMNSNVVKKCFILQSNMSLMNMDLMK